jgi:hypothetical protein
MIKKCVCTHAWQDKKYGEGNRVANEMKNGNYRCTVCGKEMMSFEPKKK